MSLHSDLANPTGPTPWVGRHTEKIWDWDAFPASRGYPELSRAQMRYIGAGGSPKVGDSSTLGTKQFTCSLLYQEPQHYAAIHEHEIEEIFLVHKGRLTVSWDFDGETLDVILGEGDALVNPAGRAHGFRNDGPTPVLAQFMVGHPKPMLPQYKTHPSGGALAPTFGAPLPDPNDPRSHEIGRWVVRAVGVPSRQVDLPGGQRMVVQPYVMPASQGGVVAPGHFSLHMIHLPAGSATPRCHLDDDLAVMVCSGQLTASTFAGDVSTARLGRWDLVRLGNGQDFQLANDGPSLAHAAVIIGSAQPPAELWSPRH